jgi:hypothetical protein
MGDRKCGIVNSMVEGWGAVLFWGYMRSCIVLNPMQLVVFWCLRNIHDAMNYTSS